MDIPPPSPYSVRCRKKAYRRRYAIRGESFRPVASLYQAFEPADAIRVARKFELVHTPKHGSWLNMAESELSVVTRRCLGQRISEVSIVDELARRWATERNQNQKGIDWQFRTVDARIKLKYLYPKIET